MTLAFEAPVAHRLTTAFEELLGASEIAPMTMVYFRRNPMRSKRDQPPIQPETAQVIDRTVRTYEAYLRTVLCRRGVRSCDVDDELQHLWEMLVDNAAQLHGNIRAWLVTVAINRSGNYHQERARYETRFALGVEQEFVDGKPDAEAVLIGAELVRLVDELDPELRAVVVERVAGKTTGEISDSLRIPQGTVTSRLRRARAQIEAALSRDRC